METMQIELPSYIPYHVPYEETLLSVVSSLVFNELELSSCPKTTLRDLIETPQYGYTATSSKEPVGAKYVRITDIQAGKINWDSVPYCACDTSEKYLLEENDILFARTGGTTGKSFIVKGNIPKAVFASYLIRIRAKAETDPDFLYWFFQTKQYWSQIKEEKIGSAQPNVNGKKLASLEIYSPKTDVQQTLAAYLSAYKRRIYSKSMDRPIVPDAFKRVDENIARIERFFEGIRQVLALRREIAKEEEELSIAFKLQVFKKVMDGKCLIMKLDDVAPVNMGQSPPGKSYNDYGKGIPLLNGPTEFGQRNPKAVQWTTSPTKLCKQGDILICVRGATTGKMNWADREYCIGRGLAALTPRPECCASEYVYYFIETQTQQMLALTAGSTFPNLPGAKLKRLDIPVPSLAKQKQVVEYVTCLNTKTKKLQELNSKKERETEELVSSILAKAFSGTLTDAATVLVCK